MSPLTGTLRQVALPTHDLDRAVAFYGDVLGLPPIGRFGHLAFFDLGGVRLLLEGAPDDAEGGVSSVLYLAVDDIHAAHRELVAREVAFDDEPHLIHRDTEGTFGPAGEEEWMAFFRDPEGHILALSSRERPAG
jgi:catechol 2,3-dioxygenase-like lactoylglutathione lyase family enzyme